MDPESEARRPVSLDRLRGARRASLGTGLTLIVPPNPVQSSAEANGELWVRLRTADPVS